MATQVTPIRDLKGYLEPDKVERLIAVVTNPRDALLVRIPWRTGIRASELIAIRTQDLDFENKAIAIKVQNMRNRGVKVVERRRRVRVDHGTLGMMSEYQSRENSSFTEAISFSPLLGNASTRYTRWLICTRTMTRYGKMNRT